MIPRTGTIAVLSDVHGNLPALEAVLRDVRKSKADAVWHLGDFLGYGPYVNEVVELLFENCSAQVIGNYDLKVLHFSKKQPKTRNTDKFMAIQWAWKELSAANSERLATLPEQLVQQVHGLRFLLTHGGPAAVDEAIDPDTPRHRLEELAAMTDADVILCGHTHLPFLQTVAKTTFVNPGSVGRPEGQDPRASYAILNLSDGQMHVHFRKIAYDVDRLSRAIREAGLPEDFSMMFKSGKDLDQVQQEKEQQASRSSHEMEERLVGVRQFAQRCHYEAGHTEQVLRLSKLLFGRLKDIHHLGNQECFLIQSAALLHDIGWLEGRVKHHKTSMRMILQAPSLGLDETDRKMAALIARYHRRALPKPNHAVYCDLSARQRRTVRMLSAVLRIADGLDCGHMSVIDDVTIEISDAVVAFCCKTRGPAPDEMTAAAKKADLFEMVFKRKTRFTMECCRKPDASSRH